MAALVMGGTTAYAATRFPAYAALLETCAGLFLIGGLALLGVALSPLLAQP
ncbi:MAG TPA: hypothetical protein VHD14_00240 [Pseudolabrys sp.]|jgi:hypothetical protein|nr:hypothetical protein [Pseudolabrys sp.]